MPKVHVVGMLLVLGAVGLEILMLLQDNRGAVNTVENIP
jgi:hypothetical protein